MRAIRRLGSPITVPLVLALAVGIAGCARSPRVVVLPSDVLPPLTTATATANANASAPAEPSEPADPFGTPSPGGVTPPVSPSAAPGTTEQPMAPGELSGSRATITGTAGREVVQVTLDTLDGEPVYVPPYGILSISWMDSSGDRLRVGATSMANAPGRSRPPDLGLEAVVAGSGTFSSSSGDCTIRLTKTTSLALAGTYSCKRLHSDDGVKATLQGRFSATFG